MNEHASRADKKANESQNEGRVGGFINNAFFYHNDKYFYHIEEKAMKERVLFRIKGLVSEEERKSGRSREDIFGWLAKFFSIINEAEGGCVLFGGAVYRKEADLTSDLDTHIIALREQSDLLTRNLNPLLGTFNAKPRFLNNQYTLLGAPGYDGIMFPFKRYGLFNHLIIISNNPVPPWLLEAINEQRAIVENAPFCDGGIGELIVYASIKILEKKEEQYFATYDEAKYILSKKIPVIGTCDLMGFPDSPEERHAEAKNIFRGHFDEKELYSLALAALNRIRAKKEKREELAQKFICAIKQR